MVNILSIALTHALMLYAAYRLLLRDDLNVEPEWEVDVVVDNDAMTSTADPHASRPSRQTADTP